MVTGELQGTRSDRGDPPGEAGEEVRSAGDVPRRAHGRPWREVLSPRNIGALYVLVVICVIFGIWVPDTFLTQATLKQLVNGNAITAMAALALIVPLSTRTFDLSFAYTMSLAGVTAAYLVVDHGAGVPLAFAGAIGVAVLVGVINGFVVVVMRIDSFIATLATGSLIQSFIIFFTDGGININSPVLSESFSRVGQGRVGGVSYPVFVVVGLAVVLWLFMEHTSTGRRLYATGFNPEAAKLANIRTDLLRFCSLVTCAAIAGMAGVILASQLASGSTSAGTAYLLPAFAAAFVGATQFKGGRFNAWGTIVAVLMLGTGILGLALASAPAFSSSMFTGLVLIAALAGAGARRRTLLQGSGGRMDRFWSLVGRRRTPGDGQPDAA